jgi:hypothetical protein
MAMACSKEEEAPAADTMAVAPAPMMNLADMAGTWSMKVMPQASDSVVASGEITGTSTTDGWVMMLADRNPIPLTVSVSGDSVMMDSAPYESVLRKGVQVWTHTVSRMHNGMLMGTTTAHYASGQDTVVMLRMEATKKP